MSLTTEVQKRRTFAIISHPDAGKTTLTEKFLLYGGALKLAGTVSAKKQQRAATSDWMELEKKRGISISSTVLNFEYNNFVVNLLDTPGHQDFSEDTYRTLMAADSVIMLIDNAKGVETQTEKLFQVCKRRNIPVVTFINKMDRMGREPLELLDEVERTFNIQTYAFNWPIGSGQDFKGVYDRINNEIHLFERTHHGQHQAPVSVMGIHDPVIKEKVGEAEYKQLLEELEILNIAGNEFDKEAYLSGEMSPVFFGSAANNFGIQLFLDAFLPLAPAPIGRQAENLGEIKPDDDEFSGFIFKIQANMDPSHRDCVAFMRICSGKFERDMTVKQPRTGKTIRLSHSHKLFGQDRETSNEGFAGDIIGFTSNQGILAIGDTLCLNRNIQFEAVPKFTPELFASIRNPNPSKYKNYMKGLQQLGLEGAIQLMYLYDSIGQRNMVLGAVGGLQFEVLQFRMQSEYGVETIIDRMPEYTHARWIVGDDKHVQAMTWMVNARKGEDLEGRPMALIKGEWALNYMLENNPDIQFIATPPA
jgi:peptide chain release factor 3